MIYVLSKEMVNKILKIGLFYFMCLTILSNSLLSQNRDSLPLDSYPESPDLLLSTEKNEGIDSLQSKLLKAQKEKDTIAILSSYTYVGILSADETYINYLDSILTLTKNRKHLDSIRAWTYYDLHIYYTHKFEYIKALKYLDIAKKYATLQDDKRLLKVCKFSLVNIKATFGSVEEALNLYKEEVEIAKENTISKNDSINQGYNYSILSYYLTMSKNYDSARYYNKIGRSFVKDLDLNAYEHLEANDAIIDYYSGDYEKAKQAFEKLKIRYGTISTANYSEVHYYLGKIYKNLGDYDASYYHLKKIDSLYEKTKKINFEHRDSFYELMNMHKNDDYEIGLQYLNKLLRYDSIYRGYASNINNKVHYKFDIPDLIKEKKVLIAKLSKENKKFKTKSSWYLGAGVLILILLGYQTYRVFKYRQKVKIQTSELNKPDLNKKSPRLKNASTDETLYISREIVTVTLSKLDRFEKELGFLNSNLTLQELAKQVSSNSKYLSRIIKIHKEESFYGYIQKLRINYTVNRLRNDTKFREFTIEAIAVESGYNQRESFSLAFNKVIGVRPSYFIKELKKDTAETPSF
ncbi:helix-turn-helix domain-containing protein [Aquimarina sp. 2201CG5-10]|uniref:helix-turn-helix domain-containing protein n=1 Tax=Aquimarina callyspongiae TaxID=3098150 RepID=UPI002AB397A8|nr:helix-turn-helix domain-containing protein [Aquimarina sp. 2201CG5-10]MDY8137855.1 helix-turn-helix domain-containing protein [Aquimarina sp. 2201CG5-10]